VPQARQIVVRDLSPQQIIIAAIEQSKKEALDEFRGRRADVPLFK
jgi:hypothetical protein